MASKKVSWRKLVNWSYLVDRGKLHNRHIFGLYQSFIQCREFRIMAKLQSIYRFVVIASLVALLFCEVDAAKRRGGRKNGELAIRSKRLFPPWRCQVSPFWIQAFSVGLFLSTGTSRSHKFRNAGYLFLALFVFIFAPVLFTFINALRKDPAVPQVCDAPWLIIIACSKSHARISLSSARARHLRGSPPTRLFLSRCWWCTSDAATSEWRCAQ